MVKKKNKRMTEEAGELLEEVTEVIDTTMIEMTEEEVEDMEVAEATIEVVIEIKTIIQIQRNCSLVG